MKDNNIIVLFRGGLGNQLYIYSFYRWLKKQCVGKRVLADLTEYSLYIHHSGFELISHLGIDDITTATRNEIFRNSGHIPIFYSGKGGHRIDTIRKKINKTVFKEDPKKVFVEGKDIELYDVMEAIQNNVLYYDGFWQDAYFFNQLKNEICDSINFKVEKDPEVLRRIINTNSASIHVRRGDFVGATQFGTVGVDYYKKAVELLLERDSDVSFYIFSDDKEYVEQHFNWLKNKTIVTENFGNCSYLDMYYMSKCRHQILSNSTFSVWAAYLSQTQGDCLYPEVRFLEKKILEKWIPVAV